VEEEYHALYRVQLHEIPAFGAHLLGANGIGAAGRERAATARNIEAVVSRDLELARKERVGRFLQAAIGAGNYQRARSRRGPSEIWFGWHCHRRVCRRDRRTKRRTGTKIWRFCDTAWTQRIFVGVALSNDPFDLERFVRAQAPDYDRALLELRDGEKRSHWMWYIFPQIEGLGQSPMSHRYSIKGAAEAEAYLAHPILGTRLRECAAVVNGIVGRSALEIFGSPDDMKLRSCATLFASVSDDAVFEEVLQKYFNGRHDEDTLRLLIKGKST